MFESICQLEGDFSGSERTGGSDKAVLLLRRIAEERQVKTFIGDKLAHARNESAVEFLKGPRGVQALDKAKNCSRLDSGQTNDESLVIKLFESIDLKSKKCATSAGKVELRTVAEGKARVPKGTHITPQFPSFNRMASVLVDHNLSEAPRI